MPSVGPTAGTIAVEGADTSDVIMQIRSHLLLLAFGAIVPVALFSIYISTLLVENEQRTFAEGSIERLRSTMSAIDAQAQGQMSALRVLASSPALDADDLDTFQAETARVLLSQENWHNILLAAPDGRLLVNIAAPWRAKERAFLLEPDLAPRVVATKAPVAGSVISGPGTKRRGIDLAVPVMRGNEVKYVLIGFVKPEFFLTSIEKQRIERRWVSGLVDAHGTFIARVPPPQTEKAAPGFIAAIQKGLEGWYRGNTLEGTDAYTAHVTSSFTHWSIGLGIPADEVLAGAHHTARLMTAGIVAALALATLLAVYFGRRVSRPVVALAEAAPRIASGTPLDVKKMDRVKEVQVVASALNEAAAAVRDRQAVLQREKQALQEADRAKDEFIAMMSHELRNPLAALASASHLLEVVDPGHESAKRAREIITRQTKHTTRLIEDLLDVSRIVMGKAYLQLETFNLADAARSVYETWRSSGRFRRHDVTLDAADAWVQADRSRVEQIISNLLDNALKFTPEGTRVQVVVTSDGANARVQVVDEGPGLPRDMVDKAFDLFVQGPQGLARKTGGMGIGLALVKRLAELQGGSVAVSSDEGTGAVFTVSFLALPAPREEATTTQDSRLKPRRILLIEDNDDLRQTVAASLTLRGHEVYEAPDGETGLRLAGNKKPDIAIIDIGLPDIDGYEVARQLRANRSTLQIGLVALTGYGQQEDKLKAAAAGFDKHLTKPVDFEALDHALAASLSGQNA